MIYITSDQHLNHVNIIKYCNRPFKSVEEMNETIIDNFNSIVTVDDETYHLGDFALGDASKISDFILRLNGTHILIPGNHDKCFPVHRKKYEVSQYLDRGFAEVMENKLIHDSELGNILLHHYPYVNSNNPPEWNKNRLQKSNKFDWLFHGHIHEKRKIDIKNKMVNVGVDVWDFRPITLQQIKEEINKLI